MPPQPSNWTVCGGIPQNGHRFPTMGDATAAAWDYGKTATRLYFRYRPVRTGFLWGAIVEAYDVTTRAYVGTLEPNPWWENEHVHRDDNSL